MDIACPKYSGGIDTARLTTRPPIEEISISNQDPRIAGPVRIRVREIAIVVALLVAITIGFSVRHGLVDPRALSPSHDITAK